MVRKSILWNKLEEYIKVLTMAIKVAYPEKNRILAL